MLAEVLHFKRVKESALYRMFKSTLDSVVEFGTAILIVALFAEIYIGWKVSELDSQRFIIQTQKLDDQGVTLQDAKDTQEKMREYTDKLRQAVAPRMFESGVVERAIKPFSSAPAVIMSAQDEDTSNVAAYLKMTFETVHMSEAQIAPDQWIPPSGIEILYRVETDASFRTVDTPARGAAVALCTELRKQGLDVRSKRLVIMQGVSPGADVFWNPNAPKDGILVRVGPKSKEFFEQELFKEPPLDAKHAAFLASIPDSSCS